VTACAGFNASLWTVAHNDVASLGAIAQIMVNDLGAGDVSSKRIGEAMLHNLDASDSGKIHDDRHYRDTMVVTNPEQWPKMISIDDALPRGVERYSGLRISLFPQRDLINPHAPYISFTDEDVLDYFDLVLNSSLMLGTYIPVNTTSISKKNKRLNDAVLQAITHAIDKAVKGVVSFEFVPYSDPAKADKTWVFLRVDLPKNKHNDNHKSNKHTASSVMIGWMFKQSYASDSIWNKSVDLHAEYEHNVDEDVLQWMRLSKPLIVTHPDLIHKMDHTLAKIPYYSHESLAVQGSGIIALNESTGDKKMDLWWAFSKELQLSTCIMIAYKIPVANLRLYDAKPIGDGAFGKVLETTWEHRLYDSDRAKTSMSTHRDEMLKRLIKSKPHLSRQGDTLNVALALKFVKGGYRTNASDLLSIMMEKSWSIKLTHMPPVKDLKTGIVFDNRYINPTFGYILHNNYIGFVMDLQMSDLGKEIDAYNADVKFILQSLMTPVGLDGRRPQSPLWTTNQEEMKSATSDSARRRGAKHLSDAYLMRNISTQNTITPRKNRTMPVQWPHVLKCAAHALAFMHLNGIVHRDVKPPNILISHDGDGILADLTYVQYMGKPDKVRGTTGYKPGVVNLSGAVGEASRRAPDNKTPLKAGIYDYPDGSTDIYALGVSMEEVALLRADEDKVKQAIMSLVQKCKTLPDGFTMVDVYLELEQIETLNNAIQ
jgi:serine/threonine protein kinase